MSADYLPRVVGLDLSLTSTGLSDGQSCHAVQTTPAEPVERRLIRIGDAVTAFIERPSQVTDRFGFDRPADLVVIEGSAFSRKGPGHEELAALRLMVRAWCFQHQYPFAVIPPSTLKLYTTGMGNATKAEMEQTLHSRHGLDLSHFTLKAGRADMVDAYALAAMGADFIGHPFGGEAALAPCPPVRDSLHAVTWPYLICKD